MSSHFSFSAGASSPRAAHAAVKRRKRTETFIILRQYSNKCPTTRGQRSGLISAHHNEFATGMSFVSARELEAARLARKEQQREMREEILREAKESFEKDKKREELKRARGEDTWILPAVRKRLDLKGQTNKADSEKKKRKKKKKEKKHKKHKSSSKSAESGSEGSEGDDEGDWVEKEGSSTVPSATEDKSSRYLIHTPKVWEVSFTFSITILCTCIYVHTLYVQGF